MVPESVVDLSYRVTLDRLDVVRVASVTSNVRAQLRYSLARLETLRRRYVISYTSTNSTRDGAFRKVEIRSRKEGIAVLTSGGYNAPDK